MSDYNTKFLFFQMFKGYGHRRCRMYYIALHLHLHYNITAVDGKKHTRKTTGMVLITKMSDLLDIVPLYLVFCEYALKFNVIRNI